MNGRSLRWLTFSMSVGTDPVVNEAVALAVARREFSVMSLDTLAERGGVLDDLGTAGFNVRSSCWKRQDVTP